MIKGNSQVSTLKQGNQVRGVFHVLLYIKSEVHDLYYEMHDHSSLCTYTIGLYLGS